MSRDEFSEETKRTLAARAGYRCSYQPCGLLTSGPSISDSSKRINNGVAAHICAAAPGGPRYDPNMTAEERKSLGNGIWMCRNHGSLIDVDCDTYSVELLKEWKISAEKRAHNELSGSQLALNGFAYSEHDKRLLKWFDSFLPYDVIMAIRDEPFRSFVPDTVVQPFNVLINSSDDPIQKFHDFELEGIRCELVVCADKFLRHFSRQSAGWHNGYQYIDFSKMQMKKIFDPSFDLDYWERESEQACSLAHEFHAVALRLREKQRYL